MEGTFKACPLLFCQLFTINIFVKISSFVYASARKSCQVFYKSYKKEIRRLFPTSALRDCYYLFNHAIWTWAQNNANGHAVLYEENCQFRTICSVLQ